MLRAWYWVTRRFKFSLVFSSCRVRNHHTKTVHPLQFRNLSRAPNCPSHCRRPSSGWVLCRDGVGREELRPFSDPPCCHSWPSVFWPTPTSTEMRTQSSWLLPELIEQGLNGQGRIPFRSIVDQQLGAAVFRDSLPDSLKTKLRLFKCVVGAARGTVRFAHSGQTGSRISEQCPLLAQCGHSNRWVKSRQVQCTHACPLSAKSGHQAAF